MAEKETPTTESTNQEGARRHLSLLAADLYGSNYHAREQPEQPEEEPEVEEKEEQEETEETEEHEGSGEDVEEASSESEEQEETEEVSISSLQELIEHNEWDPEWVNSLKVPVKVDGQSAEASLQDLVANYQMNQAAEKRLEEAKAKRESLTKELTEKQEAVQGQYAAAAKLVEQAEKMLDRDTSAIDWKRLREDDPAEYSAKKAEIAERRQELEQLKRNAAQEYRQAVDAERQKAEAEYQETLKAEQDALLEKIPEWRDQGKAAEEKSHLVKYLMSQGFTEQDVMGAADHRLILLARKAMLHDRGQQRVDTARKKVAKVPKVLKPGAPKPKADQERQKLEKLQTRLKKSGSMEDAFSLLKARRGG